MRNSLIAVYWLVAFVSSSLAGIIHVPSEQPTIQAGIDAATPLIDTVMVAPGTYIGDGNRDIDFYGKDVYLLSDSGAEVTILDVQGSEAEPHSAFDLSQESGPDCVIDGFTITGAYNGTMYLGRSSIIIKNCIFSMNTAGSWGNAGIVIWSGSPSIIGCSFLGNTSYSNNGSCILSDCGFTFGPVLKVTDCYFYGNSWEPIYSGYGNTLIITNCVFENNSSSMGGAIYSHYAELYVTACLFLNNSASSLGGAIMHRPDLFQGPFQIEVDSCTFIGNSSGFGEAIWVDGIGSITNNTFYDNSASNTIAIDGGEIELNNNLIAFNQSVEPIYGTPSSMSCNNIFGNAGGDWIDSIANFYGIDGNISLDPMFCDTAAHDLSLSVNSPCTPFNNDCWLQLIGANPVGCDVTCGDANASGFVDIDDVMFIYYYIFREGPPPNPIESGDVNCSGFIDIDDIVYLLQYIFAGGPYPCDPNGDSIPDC